MISTTRSTTAPRSTDPRTATTRSDPNRTGAVRGRDAEPRPTRRGDDQGFTIIEVLIGMVLLVVVGSMAAAYFRGLNGTTNVATARSAAMSQLQDASTALTRDVADAQVIEVADATQLKLLVVRNDLCNQRTYTVAGGEFQVVTDFYAQATCAGPTTSKTVNLVDSFTVSAPFSYIDTNLVTLTTPVSEIRGITAVQWHLARDVAGTVNGVSRDAAQPYEGKNQSTGNGTQAVHALAPFLSVITTTTGLEGRNQPRLSWVDNSPSVTASWKVWRAAWPEGGTQASWSLLTTIADPAVTSFTDMSLPMGYTAQYTVQPVVAGGTETPQSNVVTTGLRPDTPTGIAATGQLTSIKVVWNQAVGATAYDLYRDGTLYQHLGNVTTYTDNTGYGHSHTYAVVGWSRWEALVLGGTQGSQAAIGDPTTKTYQGSTARLISATVGAYTAPAAPTVSLTANTDWSNTLTWTAAPWTGAGPTTVGGVNRDRGWTGDVNSSNTSTPSGTWSALWGGAEATPATPSRTDAYTQAAVAGQWRDYRVTTCNPSGCSPTSAVQTILQRPPVPTCSATATSTRAATVTIAEPAMVSTYVGTQVGGGTAAPGYGVAGTGVATSNQTVWAIDQLAAGAGSTFTAATQNGSPANSGWSDATSCGTTTPPLGIVITGVSSGTRWINATAAATNGSSQSMTLENVSTYGGTTAGYWDPLSDGSWFTVTAQNTDGVNNATAQTNVATKTLYASMPTCSASVTAGYAPGGISVSGGNETKLGSSGWINGSPYGYTGLGAGTYTPYAGNRVSDGYNVTTAWDSCPSQTIQPAYSTAWGAGVSYGCPGLAVYASGAQAWEVRRATDTNCELQWVETTAGETDAAPAGTVMSTGSYVLGSGASAYTPGSGSGPFGPLYWG